MGTRNPSCVDGVGRGMSVYFPTRRSMAMAQVLALSLSLGLSFEVSACPPGMDTGMEMPMPDSAMDCPFGGSMDDDGGASCPLAVGGIGTCGTNAPTPAESSVTAHPRALGAAPFVGTAASRAEFSGDIQLPPPRR
jgi:hypothetical protein